MLGVIHNILGLDYKMTKYKCGHETKGVLILDSNPISMAEWMQWSETVGFHGDKSQCFECWVKSKD